MILIIYPEKARFNYGVRLIENEIMSSGFIIDGVSRSYLNDLLDILKKNYLKRKGFPY